LGSVLELRPAGGLQPNCRPGTGHTAKCTYAAQSIQD
jgi:hypothetical protein